MNDVLKKNKLGGRPTKCPDLAKLSKLYEDFSAREIARIYDVPYETCRGWIKRAKKRIREQEQEQEQEQRQNK